MVFITIVRYHNATSSAKDKLNTIHRLGQVATLPLWIDTILYSIKSSIVYYFPHSMYIATAKIDFRWLSILKLPQSKAGMLISCPNIDL